MERVLGDERTSSRLITCGVIGGESRRMKAEG
jgi:hypothetical protein